jgi:hypothetical protein
MNKTVVTALGLPVIIFTFFFSTPAFPSTDTFAIAMTSYFIDLKNDFNQFASSPIIKNPRPSKLQGYFTEMLKKHPQFESLIKVDAKGLTVIEQIRDKKQDKKKRRITNSLWFSRTAKSLKEYNCLLKEKNGRYYIYWCIPVFRDNSASRRFGGAIVAKVDLRDCFHAIAMKGYEPFLVRLNNKNVYEHLWKTKMIFVETILDVPGMEKVIVRYQKSGVSTIPQSETSNNTPPDTLLDLTSASSPIDSHGFQKGDTVIPSVSATKKNMPIVVSLIVFIVVVLVLLIIQIADRINRKRSERQGNDFP